MTDSRHDASSPRTSQKTNTTTPLMLRRLTPLPPFESTAHRAATKISTGQAEKSDQMADKPGTW